MGSAKGWRGESYDDTFPLYVEVTPDYVIHAKTGQTLTLAGIQAAMADENYTPNAGEVATSSAWQALNDGWWNRDDYKVGLPSAQAVTGLPITGDAGGTQTVDLDLDFHKMDVFKPITATVTYDVGSGDATATAALTVGMTPARAASAIQAAIDAVAELNAAKTGTKITVTPNDGITLSKLEVAFS